MNRRDEHIPVATKLDEIVEEFADLDGRERLELLLEFAERLPPLPEKYAARRESHRIHECQTPVYLFVEVEHGAVQIHAEVAPEAPTVQGFVGILVEAFSGASPDEVLAARSNLLYDMGLTDTLGMMRTQGLNGVLRRIRTEVGRAAARQETA